MSDHPTAVALLFTIADEAMVSLWRDGGAIRYRAAGTVPTQLAAGLREHRGDVLAALAAYPGGRREPGANNPTATEQSEALVSALSPVVAEHERGKWTANLARLWSRGVPGREAARQAHAALEARARRLLDRKQSCG